MLVHNLKNSIKIINSTSSLAMIEMFAVSTFLFLVSFAHRLSVAMAMAFGCSQMKVSNILTAMSPVSNLYYIKPCR